MEDEAKFKTDMKDVQTKLEGMKQSLEFMVNELNDMILSITNNDSPKVELSNLMKGLQMRFEEMKQNLESSIKDLNDVILKIATIDTSKMDWSNFNETVEKCVGTSDYEVAGE